MIIIYIKQHLKLNSLKTLSNTEAELKKPLLIKKACHESGAGRYFVR